MVIVKKIFSFIVGVFFLLIGILFVYAVFNRNFSSGATDFLQVLAGIGLFIAGVNLIKKSIWPGKPKTLVK